MKYLAKAWGVGVNYPTTLLKQTPANAAAANKPNGNRNSNPVHLPVIDSLAAAKVKYSARNMYIANRIHQRKQQEAVFAYENQHKSELEHVFREEAKAEFLFLSPDELSYWEQ